MSLLFDGTNQVDVSGWTNYTVGSISFWIKFDTVTGRIMGSDNHWEIRISGGTLRADFFGDGPSGTFTPTTGVWYHVAVTFDDVTDNQTKVYIDDSLDASGGAYNASASNTTFSLGTRNGSTERMIGRLDDVRVYNRKLSRNEISTIYGCRGNDNIYYGLKHRWLLNEKHSGATATGANSIKNSAEGGLDGTPSGSPLYRSSELKIGRAA